MHDNEASVLPEDVQTAFDNATETFTGSELKPVVYVASQAVAGTNYMILCEAATTTETPAESYQMVVVFEFYPYPGRIWSNYYNGSLGWTGWRYTQALTPST